MSAPSLSGINRNYRATELRFYKSSIYRWLLARRLIVVLGLLTIIFGAQGAANAVQTASTTVQINAGSSTSEITIFQNIVRHTITITWSNPNNLQSFQVGLDDTTSFLRPILSKAVLQNTLTLNIFTTGLAPGVTYNVRIQPTGQQTSFRLAVQPWSPSYLNYSFARSSWNYNRVRVSTFSGLNWNDTAQIWYLNSSWPDAQTQVAADAYNLEIYLRAAINMAAVHQDYPLLNEVAQMLVAYQPRFTTLGAMRALQSSTMDTSMLNGEGANSIRTLIYIISNPSPPKTVRTCYLCTAQLLYPVSRLVRLITTLPLTQRTTAMKALVQWYGPLIVQDHLMNLLYDAPQEARVQEWTLLLARSPYVQHTVQDSDLWLIATAAEVLGANANDPTSVPLTSDQKSKLLKAVSVGVDLFQSKKTEYPETRNFQGTLVGSASYFTGDDQSSEVAYSGYTGVSFPNPIDRGVQPGLSWDSSHFSRIPVFLRALYDNRKATRLDFPTGHVVQMLINQYLYKVFQGDFSKPLFNNYFDGSNGWYRVGYNGKTFGYPPAEHCNAIANVGIYQQPCLTFGEIQGWGLIAFFDAKLTYLEYSSINLAWSTDPAISSFRDRYYGTLYKGRNDVGNVNYTSNVLFWMLAQIPEKLHP